VDGSVGVPLGMGIVKVLVSSGCKELFDIRVQYNRRFPRAGGAGGGGGDTEANATNLFKYNYGGNRGRIEVSGSLQVQVFLCPN
jgi:hypothetical protein